MPKTKEKRICDWEIIRSISLMPRPKCGPVKWKVKTAIGPMFSGRIMYLCDYHKKNLLLKFEKVEKYEEDNR